MEEFQGMVRLSYLGDIRKSLRHQRFISAILEYFTSFSAYLLTLSLFQNP